VPGGHHARLLREALGRLASVEVLDSVLDDALRRHGLEAVPEDPATFGSFACGALREAVSDRLGDEAAEAVLADLAPAFLSDPPDSGVRRRKRHSLAAPSEDAPVVLLGSGHPALVDALTPRLRNRAKVVAAYDIFALLQAAQSYPGADLLLVIDDAMEAVRPSTLGTLARLLPEGTKVILFGPNDAAPELRDGIERVEWLRLGNVTDFEAVADMCLAALPRGDEADDPISRLERAPKLVVAHGDATWRARITRALVEAGYAPITAPDGFMALEHCIDEQPAAVIAGLQMPTLDGHQLVALLRSRFGREAPPVILVAEGELPEPTPGVFALVRQDAPDDDLLAEIAACAGVGATLTGFER